MFAALPALPGDSGSDGHEAKIASGLAASLTPRAQLQCRVSADRCKRNVLHLILVGHGL